MSGKGRIVFMGTPEFSVPSLSALIDEPGFDVVCVVTQPDRPKGRGRKPAPSPVKTLALRHGIPVLEPLRIRDEGFIDTLRGLKLDFIVVVAYGKILPPSVLEIPKMGCINLHASLLPKYRGASPINWAIMRGEKETGVCTMLMDEGMDTGPLLLEERVSIGEDETAEELERRLSLLGPPLVVKTLKLLAEGRITPRRQDNSLVTYAPMLKKEDGRIDWRRSAQEIKNLVRGVYPWPGAYTHLRGKVVKIHRVRVYNDDSSMDLKGIEPGTVLNPSKDRLAVRCGSGVLEILELQMENKRRMKADEFLRGTRIERGERFV